MKRFLTTTMALSLAWTAVLADARDDVKSAAKTLSEAANYTWVATTEIEGVQFTPPTITGTAETGGFAVIESERDGTTTTAVLKGDKGVLKTDDGWQTAEEVRAAAQNGGGGGGGRGGRGGMLLRTKLPAEDLAKLADKTKELKEADGVISGDLTDEGAKEAAARGGRGGQAPEPKNAKGSLKVWLKEGKLAKVQVKVSATVTMQNEERDITRTTTYEFKNVGSTTVTVSDEAKKKLGS